MKQYYFHKFNHPRKSFMVDMTAEERIIMQKHGEYRKPSVDIRTEIVLGPVFAPEDDYGIAVVSEILMGCNNYWYGQKEDCSRCASSI